MQNEMQRGAFALAGQLQEDGLQEVAHGPARLRRALCCSTWLNSSFGWLFTRHPRFHFLTIKVLHPHLHAAPWLYVKKWNRKADRRHVWLFFFFFFFLETILLARLRALHCAVCQTARPPRPGCCFFNQAGVELGSRVCATVEFRCQGHNCA